MFLRPNLTSIRNSIYSDVVSETGQPALRRSILSALTWAEANAVDGLYQYLDWISLQSVPFTAQDEYLAAWAALVGVTRKMASIATGSVMIVWTDIATLPAGTVLSRSDGATYTVDTTSAHSAGSYPISITASDAGSASNCSIGDSLFIMNPLVGISSSVTAISVTGGADDEIDDLLRTRMLLRYAKPPQGGSSADYMEWAMTAPGVTRAWVNGLGVGAGTVVVYVMLDDVQAAHSGFPQGSNGVASSESRGIPATGDQLKVANVIYPLRPVTAIVFVVSPTALPVNFTFTELAPDTPAIRAAISANLTNMFLVKGSPLPNVIYQSDYTAAINAVPGLQSYNLTAPSGEITNTMGQLPVLGTVSYTL